MILKKEISKASKKELEKEILLYADLGIIIDDADNLTTLKELKEKVEFLVEKYGYAIDFTPKFIEENPELSKELIDQGHESDTKFFISSEGSVNPHVQPESLNNSDTKLQPESIAVVRGKSGNVQYVRTYSLKTHGVDFMDLASGFINKAEYLDREYRLVDPTQIKHLLVLYREKEDFEKKLDDQKPDSPIIDKERTFTVENGEQALTFASEKKATVLAVGL